MILSVSGTFSLKRLASEVVEFVVLGEFVELLISRRESDTLISQSEVCQGHTILRSLDHVSFWDAARMCGIVN